MEDKMDYIRRRFSEAKSPEDVDRVRHELINDEKLPRGTVDTVKNEMRKRGELPSADGSNNHEDDRFPVVTRGTEVITPESIIRQLLDGSHDWQLRLEGMMLLRAAQRMVMDDVEIMKKQAEADAKLIEPVFKVMKEAREELTIAAERARSSSYEMVQEAARSAVGGVLGYIDQKIPKGPPPRDMSEMFTKRIDKMWDLMDHMMEQRMFPGYQANKPPEGWEYERLSSPAPAPKSESPAANTTQDTAGVPPGTPPSWEREQTKEESDV